MHAEVHRACRRESQGDSARLPRARHGSEAEDEDRSVCSSAASTVGAGGAASALLLPSPPGLRRRRAAAAERDGADSSCSGAPPFPLYVSRLFTGMQSRMSFVTISLG